MAVVYAAGMNFGVATVPLFESESDGLGQTMSVHSPALPSNSPFECHRTGRTYSRRCCCSPHCRSQCKMRPADHYGRSMRLPSSATALSDGGRVQRCTVPYRATYVRPDAPQDAQR